MSIYTILEAESPAEAGVGQSVEDWDSYSLSSISVKNHPVYLLYCTHTGPWPMPGPPWLWHICPALCHALLGQSH